MNLTGWQLVASLAVGAGLGALGAIMHADSLVTLAGTILGGVLGLMQPWRGHHPRSRLTDRPGAP